MSKKYSIRPQKNSVYSVDDLIQLYDVVRNTVSNWVTEGLRPSDANRPYIFNGAEVKRFHDARQLNNCKPLRIGQFKCLVCKGRVFPLAASLRTHLKNGLCISLSGGCPNCDRWVFKLVSADNFELISQCINTNTSLASLDEDVDNTPACIGNDEHFWHLKNDRVIHAWLQYAGKFDKKTINAHLAAIRHFEGSINGKDFHRLSITDVTGYRDQLKSMAHSGQLSISTIRHRVSHVKALLKWLVDQKGFTALDRTLAGYLDLPKKFDAKTLERDSKPVPSIDEAEQMVQAMPNKTRKERRDRAMVCTAFLGALRADTVSSLLIAHVKMDTKHIVQDAGQSRTKNGKSLRIWFFPVPEIFAQVLNEWQTELRSLGFAETDALFPDSLILAFPMRPRDPRPVPVMKSTNAISAAFKIASKALPKQFSPHSAKHCIGQVSWSVCRTAEERKAWSANMGHDDEDVTQRYYSKISDDRMAQIFAGFAAQTGETDEEKELMLLYHEHELSKGTAEFEHAKRLIEARRARLAGDDLDTVIE